MRSLRKKIQARASVARANLDAAILGLRNKSLEQLMEKLEQTRDRLELDGDTAWSLATKVLAKVRSVRESLQKTGVGSGKSPARRTIRKAAAANGKGTGKGSVKSNGKGNGKSKAKTRTAKTAAGVRRPLKTRKAAEKSARRAH
jgi:hypothetical protein